MSKRLTNLSGVFPQPWPALHHSFSFLSQISMPLVHIHILLPGYCLAEQKLTGSSQRQRIRAAPRHSPRKYGGAYWMVKEGICTPVGLYKATLLPDRYHFPEILVCKCIQAHCPFATLPTFAFSDCLIFGFREPGPKTPTVDRGPLSHTVT